MALYSFLLLLLFQSVKHGKINNYNFGFKNGFSCRVIFKMNFIFLTQLLKTWNFWKKYSRVFKKRFLVRCDLELQKYKNVRHIHNPHMVTTSLNFETSLIKIQDFMVSETDSFIFYHQCFNCSYFCKGSFDNILFGFLIASWRSHTVSYAETDKFCKKWR